MCFAGSTGVEPAVSSFAGKGFIQLSYDPAKHTLSRHPRPESRGRRDSSTPRMVIG